MSRVSYFFLLLAFLVAVSAHAAPKSGTVVAPLTCLDAYGGAPVFKEIKMRAQYDEVVGSDRDSVYYIRTAEERSAFEWKVRNGGLYKFVGKGWVSLTTPQLRNRPGFANIVGGPVAFAASVDGRLFGMTAPERTRVARYTNLFIHHSTFLAGRPVGFAGNIVVKEGTVRMIDNSSGHYAPKTRALIDFLRYLASQGLDMRKTRIVSATFAKDLKNPDLFRDLKEFMPEMAYIEAQAHPEMLDDLTKQIDAELKATGESLLLFRVNYIWHALNDETKRTLTEIAKARGVRVFNHDVISYAFGI